MTFVLVLLLSSSMSSVTFLVLSAELVGGKGDSLFRSTTIVLDTSSIDAIRRKSAVFGYLMDLANDGEKCKHGLEMIWSTYL